MNPRRARKTYEIDPKELLASAKTAASKLLVGKDLADEIAQKAAIAILKSGSEVSNLQAYVRTVVHRVGYAELRKQRASRPAEAFKSTAADPGPSPSTLAETSELTTTIKNLLSPDDLLLLTEHFVDGRSYSEMAKNRQLPEATLRSRINRVLASLRSKIG